MKQNQPVHIIHSLSIVHSKSVYTKCLVETALYLDIQIKVPDPSKKQDLVSVVQWLKLYLKFILYNSHTMMTICCLRAFITTEVQYRGLFKIIFTKYLDLYKGSAMLAMKWHPSKSVSTQFHIQETVFTLIKQMVYAIKRRTWRPGNSDITAAFLVQLVYRAIHCILN